MIQRESSLASLIEGARFLTSRLGTTIAMATLGTLLCGLARLLQIYANLPSNFMVDVGLFSVASWPLVIYFIPRFLMSIDAQVVGSSFNTIDDCSLRFKERWLRALGASILLGIAVRVGFCLFVIPGIIIFMAFGWMPKRILLRGESILQAAKGSLEMMRRTWKKVFVVTIAAIIISLVTVTVMAFAVVFLFSIKDPTVFRGAHPAVWVMIFIGGILGLWLNACFLSLYHRTENRLSQD